MTRFLTVQLSVKDRSAGGIVPGIMPISDCRFPNGAQSIAHPFGNRKSAMEDLAFLNGDRLQYVALLDRVDDVLAALDLAEDGVFSVEPVGDDVGDEEL